MSFKCTVILMSKNFEDSDGGVIEFPSIPVPDQHILLKDTLWHKVLRSGVHPVQDPKPQDFVDATLIVEANGEFLDYGLDSET